MSDDDSSPGPELGESGEPGASSDPGQPRRSGRSIVVLLVGAAVAVAAVALVVLWVNGDDEDDDAVGTAGDAATPSEDDGPRAVVERYFQATRERDCETLIDLVSDSTWQEAGLAGDDEALANCNDAAETGQQLEGMTLEEIGDVAEDGDVATVEVMGTYEGEPLTETFTLVREDGDWKLDLTA